MIELERYAGPLANQLEFAPTDLNVYWLGQAGFLVRSPKFSFLIDPYLSDRLAEKYRGGAFPHERLMAPPITVADVVPTQGSPKLPAIQAIVNIC